MLKISEIREGVHFTFQPVEMARPAPDRGTTSDHFELVQQFSKGLD